MKKLLILSMLGFLTSCMEMGIPDEHIEMEFDLKSTHTPKDND